MEIWVNDKKLEVFSGARVKNALRKYSEEEYQAVLSGDKQAADAYGHPLDMDGELAQGNKITIIRR